MEFHHVDVFTKTPMQGNGLTVVFCKDQLAESLMLTIAQEFKQYETAFVFQEKEGCYPIRIFTVQEELQFAGHPLIGAAGLIHRLKTDNEQERIRFLLHGRKIDLDSLRENDCYRVSMNQGKADFLMTLPPEQYSHVHEWFSLDVSDIDHSFPISVVSTGLPYLLVPVRSGLERIKIAVDDLERRISIFGAKFVYFFDTTSLECRTWDNSGVYEDVATGSAAGPLISYLVMNGYCRRNQDITLKQGRFVQRDSAITGYVNDEGEVTISGEVAFFGRGEIFI